MPDSILEPVEASTPEAAAWSVAEALELNRSAASLRVPPAVVDDSFSRGLSVDQTRRAIINCRAEQDEAFETRPHRIETGRSYDDPQSRAERIGEGLFTRMHRGHQPSEAAREFAHASLSDLAKDCLEHAGHRTRGLAPAALVTRGLHTTSDYPLALSNAVHRTLRAEYELAPRGIAQAARKITNRDFRAKALVDFAGDPIQLLEVNEAGEFTRGTIAEGSASIRLRTFGRVFGFTRQVLINDDIDMLARLPRMFARSAVAVEDQTLATLLESNPVMGDAVALFAADHSNLAGSGGAIAEATLSAARLALRTQTGLNGQPVNLVPWALVVPPQIETTAEKIVSSIQATTTASVNPFSSLRVIVDPRLTSASNWYVCADPQQTDGLLMCHLEGEEGVFIESRVGFDIDGVEVKARLDFGAAYADWRGWYKNPH